MLLLYKNALYWSGCCCCVCVRVCVFVFVSLLCSTLHWMKPVHRPQGQKAWKSPEQKSLTCSVVALTAYCVCECVCVCLTLVFLCEILVQPLVSFPIFLFLSLPWHYFSVSSRGAVVIVFHGSCIHTFLWPEVQINPLKTLKSIYEI